MEITKRIKNAVAAFRNNIDTNLGVDPNSFLKYGKRMPSSWSIPEISDQDFYTGYGFAVINKRANRSVVLGKKFLFTEAKENMVKDANEKGVSIVHPYLKLIRESVDFAERDFWYDISTYLDLEGVYFLMAVRTVASGRVGNVQKFVLLNPYWIRQVVNADGELGGYVENNPYMGTREIAKELIIPIKLLNPFDPNKSYSLADAARDSQFTLKQANDYARESINGNINSPGILSSAIELPDDQFDNFVNRVKSHGRGEPLFGNGSGTVSWVDMQTDLDKAALDKINSINRDVLLAISGLSKTGVGVEESGTGREVSRTQKDDFTENAIMPQIENIIDALNLDYRRFYATQWSSDNYNISLSNPLETNRDAEQADVDIRDSQFALMQTLMDKGYDKDIASKFAKGLISITDLGEPTTPVDITPSGDGIDPNMPNSLSKNQISARDIEGLYEGIDIDTEELGCIMLNTVTIPVMNYVDDPDDIYEDGDHTGVVGETEPHVTLLYGLLENGNVWKDKVDKVLDGWSCSELKIDEVSSFDLGDKYAIIALVEKTPELLDGHDRLTLLPHINTFSEYIPHITLAYVKHDESVKDKWVSSLNTQYAGKTVATKGINYGDVEEESSLSADKKIVEVYEGYAVPISQYLGGFSNEIISNSEDTSVIYSAENSDKFRIKTVEERNNSLIGVIDEHSYVKLGEFKSTEHKDEILNTLNKRYHDQLIAVKQKGLKLNKDFYEKLPISLQVALDNTITKYQDEDWFKQSFEDYRIHVLESTYNEIRLPGIVFNKYFDSSSEKLSNIVEKEYPSHSFHNDAFDKNDEIKSSTTVLLNSVDAAENQLLAFYIDQVSQGNLNPHADTEPFINGLSMPFAVWFTVMFPVLAYNRARDTANQLGVQDMPVTAMTESIKTTINDFSQKEATSHINTIKSDIENALAIIRTTTSDATEIKQMLQSAFIDIQKRRALLIASNAASRIFALSQYEADLQLLVRNGLLDVAFKQLFSSTGDPCRFCSYIIANTNNSPIPFTQAFASIDDELTVDGKTMKFNYENIIAGNVHPNCKCYYKITIEENAKNSVSEEQLANDRAQKIIDSVKSEITPLIDKITLDNTASDETMRKLSEAAERLDEKIVTVEDKLDQLDKRTKEARQLKEELLEANQLKVKLSEAEEYAQQLERILDEHQ